MDDFNMMDIQRNIASRLARETQMDKTVELLSVIQSLVPDGKGKIDKESILVEAGYHNITSEEAEDMLRQLVLNRTLREVDGGFMF